MRKRILLLSSVLLTLSLITVVIFNNVDNKENNIISNINKDKQVINSNMITMMYETESGSGKYIETKDISWPESGYIFNDTLSGCENGGELEYNSQNNTVNLLSNKSDQCYVYFDKYDGVWIDNVIATNITGSSVTLSVDATSENGSITTYYYSLNDSENYQESLSNVITIDDLNKLTEYNIKIYAIDNTGARSNIYELNVITTDETGPIINSVEVIDVTTSEFTLKVNAYSDVEIYKYYYIIESDDLSGISSNNEYTFNNLNPGTTYNIVIYVKDKNNNLSSEFLFVVDTERGLSLVNYLKGLYTFQGSNGIYYHTSSLTNSAGDNSYRYSGANPNNYICFGTDEETCPEDNMYRIIGVFGNEAKLIKATNIGNYKWNSSNDNTWALSDIKDTLNSTYYNSLETTWQNKIASHEWKVGGMRGNMEYTANQYYNTEIGSSSSSTTDSMKIGLMYVSDYGFAASNIYWTESLYYYDDIDLRDNNWLYLGSTEWTISPHFNKISYAFYIFNTGYVDSNVSVTDSYAIRPTFYLTSDVTYVSGSGTQSDPFRIE